jgi:hypothetical protein
LLVVPIRKREAKALNAPKKKEASRWGPELLTPKTVALAAALAAGVAAEDKMFNSTALDGPWDGPLRPTQTTFATSKRQKPRHSKAWKQRQQENQEPDRAREAPGFVPRSGAGAVALWAASMLQ